MTDQQRCQRCRGERTLRSETDPYQFDPCPACDGTGKVPAEKLVDTSPAQEPLVVPDEVIVKAAQAGDAAWWGCDENPAYARNVAQDRARIAVIIEWAREQGRAEERARIQREIEAIPGPDKFTAQYIDRDLVQAALTAAGKDGGQ